MIFKNYVNDYYCYLETKLKYSSIINIKKKFKSYILPSFGEKDIVDIKPIDYLNWQKKINKLGLSYSFKKGLHYTMVSFYSYLSIFYDYNNNIPKKVGNFVNDEIPKEMKYWDQKEFKIFIDKFEDKDIIYKTFFICLFTTGIREGEALALTFNDLKLDTIFINKTISKEFVNGSKVISSPKSKNSIRYIKLDNYTLFYINELKNLYQKKYGYFDDNFYIFGGKKSICVTTIKRKMEKYCNNCNIEKIRIHDLRHSNATFLLKHNVPMIEVSRRLGHSDINITINTYSHLSEEYEKKALSALNSIF